VVDAFQSDRSFLRLAPTLAVVTNIDEEHLEAYRDFDDLCDAFVEFANKVPFYGAAIVCADDRHLRRLRSRMLRRVVTYGIEAPGADLGGRNVRQENGWWVCDIEAGPGIWKVLGEQERPGVPIGDVRLRIPGRHNLQNALAAVAVGLELGVPLPVVTEALSSFKGADRRFQVLGEAHGVLVIDDYGHHPTEIAAVVSAARASLNRRLVVIFQPHRYSRTARLLHRFGPALAGADEVILTDIYPAGEDPIPGTTGDVLAQAMRRDLGDRVHFVRALDDVVAFASDRVRPGDAVITLGAGSIGTIGGRLLAALHQLDEGRT
jgi:UDP-N-acetylmuramate--alanine ligase